MRYDRKAIPTTYAGVNFRSRLEARWAAFFDVIKVRWIYEPEDLGVWSPDFALLDSGPPVYVEVKPLVAIDADTAVKMSTAGGGLLLGLAPNIPERGYCGWYIREDACETRRARRVPIWEVPNDPEYRSWHAEADWANACNAVQWKPRA